MREAQHLVQMQKKHPTLILAGVTTSRRRDKVDSFRERAGVEYPFLIGLEIEAMQAYDVWGVPAVRVIRNGRVVADSLEGLTALLGP